MKWIISCGPIIRFALFFWNYFPIARITLFFWMNHEGFPPTVYIHTHTILYLHMDNKFWTVCFAIRITKVNSLKKCSLQRCTLGWKNYIFYGTHGVCAIKPNPCTKICFDGVCASNLIFFLYQHLMVPVFGFVPCGRLLHSGWVEWYLISKTLPDNLQKYLPWFYGHYIRNYVPNR